MRHLILLIIISFGVFINQPATAETADEYSTALQQSPFTFMNPVPSKVKIDDKIDLSFYVNQSVVFQYRFRIEGPAPVVYVTGNQRADSWSAWINLDISELTVPKLSKEGQYRLRIEYKTHSSNEVKVFVKAFEVYGEKPEITNHEIQVKKEETKKNNVTQNALSSKSEAENANNSKAASMGKETEIKSTVLNKAVKDSVVTKSSDDVVVLKNADLKAKDNPADQPLAELKDYNKLLLNSISNGDKDLFVTCLNNGADVNITGENGGNIFHRISGKLEDEEIVTLLKQKGISLNESDKFGNTPLHLASFSDDAQYSKILLNHGANANVLNVQNLAPIHLAVLRNDLSLVRLLMNSGSDINLSGQGGYTPLHMAAELNNLAIAKELLSHDAETNAKTFQNLNPVMIAKIQGNYEMGKLLKRKGRYNYVNSIPSVINTTMEGIPNINFNLPYSGVLLKKRQTNELIQKITAPLAVTGAAAAVYFISTANTSYGNYHEAGTEGEAWSFYRKTKRFDRYTMVAAGVSVISVYGFIQSSIRKHRISEKLRRSF